MEMSFSYKVKEEIISKINTKPKADVCLMGILTFCNTLSSDEITFLTEHKSVADFFQLNVNRICESENSVSVTETVKKNNAVLYNISVRGKENRLNISVWIQADGLCRKICPRKNFIRSLYRGYF